MNYNYLSPNRLPLENRPEQFPPAHAPSETTIETLANRLLIH